MSVTTFLPPQTWSHTISLGQEQESARESKAARRGQNTPNATVAASAKALGQEGKSKLSVYEQQPSMSEGSSLDFIRRTGGCHWRVESRKEGWGMGEVAVPHTTVTDCNTDLAGDRVPTTNPSTQRGPSLLSSSRQVTRPLTMYRTGRGPELPPAASRSPGIYLTLLVSQRCALKKKLRPGDATRP